MNVLHTGNEQVAIVGFGPAGLASVVGADAAHYDRPPIIVIDAAEQIGSGGFNGLVINSNSAGDDFTKPFEGTQFAAVLDKPEAQGLVGNPNSVPLTDVAAFLGTTATSIVDAGTVRHIRDNATKITVDDRQYRVHTRESGVVAADRVLLANGAEERLYAVLEAREPSRTFLSSELLHGRRAEELEQVLAEVNQVTIIGGAHSAYSAAKLVLDASPDAQVTFLKQRPTRPFFRSLDEARQWGYTLTAADTIDAGMVNRFDGVRDAARDLWYAEQTGADSRLQSHYDADPGNWRQIDPEAVVIQALGYTARRLPFVGPTGNAQFVEKYHTEQGLASFWCGDAPLPLHGVHGIGLGYSLVDGFNIFCTQAAAHFTSLQHEES